MARLDYQYFGPKPRALSPVLAAGIGYLLGGFVMLVLLALAAPPEE